MMNTFKYFFEQKTIINEMIIDGNKTEEYFIVAFKDKIWLFDVVGNNEIDNESEDNQRKLLEIQDVLGLDEEFLTYSEISLLQEEIEEKNVDAVTGVVKNGNLSLTSLEARNFDPRSSILIKKIFQTLQLETLTVYDGDGESMFWDFTIEGKTPDIAFHGTTTEYLMNILRLGIRPDISSSNWADQNIHHENVIFFTTKPSEAATHASMTAKKQGGFPTVIEFTIPDKDLIIPDFDIDTLADPDLTQDRYYDNVRAQMNKSNPFDNVKSSYSAERLSQERGVYGYKGVIMPKFIKTVFIDFEEDNQDHNDLENYTKFDLDYIQNRINTYGEFFDLEDTYALQELLLADEWDLDQYLTQEDDEEE